MVRVVGEWEEQAAVWLAFPHNDNWQGISFDKTKFKSGLEAIQDFYFRLIDICLDYQDVKLIFNDEALMMSVIGKLASFSNKKFKLNSLVISNNDIWIRDYGPIFLYQDSDSGEQKVVADFVFNAWGGKFPPFDSDNAVPGAIALNQGIAFNAYFQILEGGAIDYSSDAKLITTKECVLNPNRNEDFIEYEFELMVQEALGIEKVLWLDRGLANDHTDGHVDNTARFISDKRVLLSYTNNKESPNYDICQKNYQALLNYKAELEDLEIIKIPIPEPEGFLESKLAYSYANFIFLNGALLVPIYNCEQDAEALEVFEKLFPERKVIGVDCSLLIQEGGSLHCMTKQEII
ncbi:MAG: agmatine deiminase family protein [Candidatus Caenarcaniphilales bacterium]|nr:agmatine deiminase family protein [Candidatus Caenarcaniphilales bacterium]